MWREVNGAGGGAFLKVGGVQEGQAPGRGQFAHVTFEGPGRQGGEDLEKAGKRSALEIEIWR